MQNGREGGGRIIGRAAQHLGRHDIRADIAHEERVAIRPGGGYGIAADGATTASAVLHHNGLAIGQGLQALGEAAGQAVQRAAG